MKQEPLKHKRMKTVILSSASSLLAAMIASGSIIRGMHMLAGKDAEGIFHYAVSEGKGLTFILFLILTTVFIVLLFRNDPRNYVVQKDERGVSWLANGTFGTSRWMSEQEAEQVFRVENIRKTTDFTTIYGQLSEHGEKTVSYRRSKYADELQNVFIVGSPGSGKSRCYVRTELINSILRGDSFIATDPSGELYATLAEWCRSRNVDVKVLNLKDFEHSDCWDCLAETVDLETGRMDGQSMMEFVTTYVCNMTPDGQKMDDFWYTMPILYLEQACALAAWNHETRVISDLSMLYRKTAESLPEYQEKSLLFEDTAPSIRELQKIILEAAAKTGYEESGIRSLFAEIEASAPPFHIAEVHRLLLHYDEIEKAYHPLSGKSAIPSNNMGMIAYLSAHQESAEQKGRSTILTSAITGTLGKLTLLTDQRLSYILSEKGIRLSEVNQHQCAYFVIPSEDTPDLRSTTGLFFSFLL
ncbi:MAG: type IV secretory system conjugative DNA transfer family protein, partial [Bulleidia sp.]